MDVEAVLETPRVFVGQRVTFGVEFAAEAGDTPPPVLLSGYAVVQGFFKLGDTMSTEPFQDTRKAGVVLGRKGFEYGQPAKAAGFLSEMLGGLKHLVINQEHEESADDGHDYPIYATSQLLLFPDLRVAPGGAQRFRLAVDLPEHLPPTYRSRSLQIVYTLVVGFQRPVPDGKPLETRLFLPFRVLSKAPTPAAPQPFVYDLRYPINAPPPVFAEDALAPVEGGDMRAFIDGLLAPPLERMPSVPSLSLYTKVHFELSRARLQIANVVLAKPAVSIGDVIAAQVQLHRACLHLSAYLELEEHIAEPYSATSAGSPPPGQTAAVDQTVISTVYARQFQSVYGLKEVALYFPTLTSTTPRLDTAQLTASWVLRLEFVGLSGSALAETDDEEECLEAKGQVDYEIFSCKIPLVVLPPTGPGHTVAKVWRFH